VTGLLIIAGLCSCAAAQPVSVTSTAGRSPVAYTTVADTPVPEGVSPEEYRYKQAIQPMASDLDAEAARLEALLLARDLSQSQVQAEANALIASVRDAVDRVSTVGVPIRMETIHATLREATYMCYQSTNDLETGLLGNDTARLDEALMRVRQCRADLNEFEDSLEQIYSG
jgi:hypothetical protein